MLDRCAPPDRNYFSQNFQFDFAVHVVHISLRYQSSSRQDGHQSECGVVEF